MQEDRQAKYENFPAYGFILLIMFFFFYPMIVQGKFPYYRDAYNFHYPLFTFMKNSILSGEYPLWNPHVLSGFAQWQLPDPSLLYPFSWLFIWFPFDRALSWIIVIHHLIAVLGMFYWLRHHQFSQMTSIVFGLTFSLSGYMLSLHNNHGFMLSCAWLPWCMVALDRLLEQPSLKTTAILATLGSMHLLCGRADITYYFAIYSVLYLLLHTIIHRHKPWFRIWAGILSAAGLSAAISGIFIMALWELKNFSINMLLGHTYDTVVAWSLNPLQLLTFFIPKMFGDPFFLGELMKYIGLEPLDFSLFIINIYCGIGTLLCLSIACLGWRRYPEVSIHIILALVMLTFVLGNYNGFFSWMYDHLPGLKSIRYPVKALGVMMLSICFLAAWGLRMLMQKQIAGNRWGIHGLLLIIAVGFGIYLLNTGDILNLVHSLSPETQIQLQPLQQNRIIRHLTSAYWLAVTIYTIYITIFYLYYRQWITARTTAMLISIFALLDLMFHNQDLLWLTTPAEFFYESSVEKYVNQIVSPIRNQQRLFYQQGFKSNMPTKFREYDASFPLWRTMKYAEGAALPNSSMVMDFLTTDGYVVPSAYYKNYHLILGTAQAYSLNQFNKFRLMALLSTSHIVVSPPQITQPLIFGKDYEPPRYFKDFNIYIARLKKTLPRTYFRGRYILSPSPDMIAKLVLFSKLPENALTFDPFREVVIDAGTSHIQYIGQFLNQNFPEKHMVDTPAVLTDSTNNTLSIYTANRKKGFLVISDVYYPGWKAYVDGQEQPILLANYFQRAVALPPGMHEVRLIYQPQSFYWGWWLSAIGWLFLVVLLIWGYWRGRTFARTILTQP